MNKISIIVPVYNVEKYIEKCLESIINQTVPEIDVILVNDGSSDNSAEICKKYSKIYNNIFLFSKENGGLSSAKNFGLSKVKTEYVMFLDSDDFIGENLIEDLLDKISSISFDICVFGSEFYFEDTNQYKRRYDLEEYKKHENRDKKYYHYDLLRGQKYNETSWDKAYKTSLFNNIIFPEGKIHEDTYTTHKLFDKAKNICFLTNTYYYYRIRSNSITGLVHNKIDFDSFYSWKSVYDYYKDSSRNIKIIAISRLIDSAWNNTLKNIRLLKMGSRKPKVVSFQKDITKVINMVLKEHLFKINLKNMVKVLIINIRFRTMERRKS